MADDLMRLLAAWALVHETADEGWKAAVARGEKMSPADMEGGPEAFVDGLTALIAEQKERLKAELASGAADPGSDKATETARVEDLRFEVGELRGRIETLQASLDALLERSGDDGGED